MTCSSNYSSLVSVKEFKENILFTVSSEEIDCDRNDSLYQNMAFEMGITEDTFSELQDVCNPENLKGAEELSDSMDNTTKTTYFSHADLATLKIMDGETTEIRLVQEGRNYITLSTQLEKAANESVTNSDKVCGPEVVLSVALYHPKKMRKVQEFLVLGRQTLTELRDKIYCPADSIVPGEHSENPDFASFASAKDICPSGFMFIENVFYNDTRDDLCRDYSKVIFDWANKKHNGQVCRFGVCTKAKMEETKFEDLTIKLGYPYLYTHQGNCEHLLIFRDLRMFHADDPQFLSNYPFHIFRPQPKRSRCMICLIYSARWLTRDDVLMSQDPCIFCEKCFKALHYKNNQKAYSFTAFRYPGDQYW